MRQKQAEPGRAGSKLAAAPDMEMRAPDHKLVALTLDRMMRAEHRSLLVSETKLYHTLVSVMAQFHMVMRRKLAGSKLAVGAR